MKNLNHTVGELIEVNSSLVFYSSVNDLQY